jgi:hypothetical protein
MTRKRIVVLAVGALVVALAAWVANNTYWGEIVVPLPMRGEARTNPFYAVQGFAESLGARTSWDHVFQAPATDAVVVISGWHWGLTEGRRRAVEQWVENGGRLVLDTALVTFGDSFEIWSGIERKFDKRAFDQFRAGDGAFAECRPMTESREQRRGSTGRDITYRVCGLSPFSSLATGSAVEWSLSDDVGPQAVRISQGRGSVTVINGEPFTWRSLLEGDHGRVFVAATGLRRGDEVHFMSEDQHPSLVSMAWRYGSPVVVLGLALVGLLLWRGGMRFGPLAPPTTAARRSLAEQIRGTGLFTLRHGGGASLHAATVRALAETAARRIPGYAHLTEEARVEALARLTDIDPQALANALRDIGPRRGPDLRQAVALVETARRRLTLERAGSLHGTH